MKKVITYGTFDLFHEGHRQILERAKKLGDYLIIGVTSDYYDQQRGKLNVEQPLLTRLENIKNSGLADEIIIEEHEAQKIADIQKYHADIFTVGSDWRGQFDYLQEYCEVVYLERTPNVSSTELRNGHLGEIKVGIVGTGRIAWRAVQELNFVSGAMPYAAYNPELESARLFMRRYELALAFDDYDAFLANVDAVHVASPNETHFEYCKRALQAGKHVICENPMVLTAGEAKELFDLAESRNLVLMEAIKTAYAPGFLSLLSIAKSGRIGEIKDVEAAYTKLIPNRPGVREYDTDYGGSFTELAGFSLLPIIKLLGKEYSGLYFDYFTDKNGVDIYTRAHLKYPGAIATAKTGIGIKSEGQLIVSGTKGYVLVRSPWWLIKSFEVCYENTHNNEHFSASFPSYGLRFELSDFVRNIRNPELKDYKLTRGDSIVFAAIMESFLHKRKSEGAGL